MSLRSWTTPRCWSSSLPDDVEVSLILDRMPPEHAADVVDELSTEHAEKILDLMEDREVRGDSGDPRLSRGLGGASHVRDVVAVRETSTVEEAIPAHQEDGTKSSVRRLCVDDHDLIGRIPCAAPVANPRSLVWASWKKTW